MSQNDKLSLWKKIKKLLSSTASQSVVDTVDARHQPSKVADTANQDSISKADDTIYTDADKKSSTNPDTSNTKSSDSKATHNHSQTPITDYLKQYFYSRQWQHTHYRPRVNDSQQSHHLSLRMKNKKIDCGYLFRVQEGNSLLAVYGILPFLIPESHQSAAMLLITQINYDMLIGNLEMDVNDGEIRYKNAIDIEVVGMHDDIIEHLLQSVIAMTTVAYEVFNDLIHTKDPSDDMPTLLGELRQQADARTFFLPTQKRQ